VGIKTLEESENQQLGLHREASLIPQEHSSKHDPAIHGILVFQSQKGSDDALHRTYFSDTPWKYT
jgi:hypothetical protein